MTNRPAPRKQFGRSSSLFPGEGVELACATRLWAPLAALMYRRSLVDVIGGFRRDLRVIRMAGFCSTQHGMGAVRALAACRGGYWVPAPSLSRRRSGRFWRDVLLNGTQIEALWRARGCLAADQRAALADIFNGAAHGLFRARNPGLRDAIAYVAQVGAADRLAQSVAQLVSDVSSQRAAVRLAELWTTTRRARQGAGRTGTKLRMGRTG